MSDSGTRTARADNLKKKRNLEAAALLNPKNKLQERVDPRKPVYKREKMSVRNLPIPDEEYDE